MKSAADHGDTRSVAKERDILPARSSLKAHAADHSPTDSVPSRGAVGENPDRWAWSGPDEAERTARHMFQRVLAPWASDVLALRSRGLDRPGFLSEGRAQATPGHRRAA